MLCGGGFGSGLPFLRTAPGNNDLCLNLFNRRAGRRSGGHGRYGLFLQHYYFAAFTMFGIRLGIYFRVFMIDGLCWNAWGAFNQFRFWFLGIVCFLGHNLPLLFLF